MTAEFTYTVRGKWPFPLDMLRHDQSRGAAPADIRRIGRYSKEFAPDRAAFQDVEIALVGPCRPNTARWESFGWSVPSDLDYVARKQAQARERERSRHRDAALAKLTQDEREALEHHFAGRRP